jgi:hypothetical protein
MRLKNLFPVFCLLYAACSCTSKPSENAVTGNPAAEGFDLAHSDPAAVELADSIMEAMGGRQAWDNTHFISWNFFGRRNLVWDKHTGRVRIESMTDSVIYLMNVNTGEGRVQVKGQEITAPDSLKKMLQKGKSMWINDSYWLVMPFKLKDKGVTLSYLGEDTLANGSPSNVLQVTFNEAADTPQKQNKYLIYVDLADNLVKQWAFFSRASQDSASFIRPWNNYKKYGGILLSADRTDHEGPGNVSVDETLPDKMFEEF